MKKLIKQKKMRSLRFAMLWRLIFCWLLPVILVVTAAGIYVTKTTFDRTQAMIESAVKVALDTMQRRVNEAVDSSLNSSYKANLRDLWKSFKQDDDYVTFATSTRNFLEYEYKYDDKFRFTTLALKDSPVYQRIAIAGNYPYTNINYFWQSVSPKTFEITQRLTTGIEFIKSDEHLYITRNIVDEYYKPFAILSHELNTEKLASSVNGLTWATNATFWLNDAQITLMGEPIEWSESFRNDGKLFYGGGASPLTVTGTIKLYRYTMRYAMYFDTSIVQSQLLTTFAVLAGVFLMLIPLMISVFQFIYKKVNRPVDMLVHASRELENGNFGALVDVDSFTSTEMNFLGETFNAMSLTLKNQFERIYKEELALRDAKIMALQSQINPHFLNNTLEIINWEARIAGDVKVCKMLEALSTMLNAAMDRKKRPLVHLSEELMYVDSYLYIIRERLGKRLTVEKEIDDETLDCYVPRLILQPVIENAVEHGITPRQKGVIKIRSYIKDNKLYLEIENDSPMTEHDRVHVKTLLSGETPPEGSTSLGIRNVNQRLKILYGYQAGLSIIPTESDTTIAVICILAEQDRQ